MSFSANNQKPDFSKAASQSHADIDESVKNESVKNWASWGLVKPPKTENVPDSKKWSKMLCPVCREYSDTPTLLAHEEGHFHCERCGFHGDAKIKKSKYRKEKVSFHPIWWSQNSLTDSAKKWFEMQGISAHTIEQCEIGMSKSYFKMLDKWEPALLFPCRQTPQGDILDLLSLHISKDTYAETQRQPQSVAIPWGWDHIQNNRVILVDHPMDRLALIQAGYDSVVCIPDKLDPRSPEGEQEWGFLQAVEKEVEDVLKFVIALRDDDRGHATEEELARRLGKEKCYRTRWQHHRLPNNIPACAIDILREFGPEALAHEIETAGPFPVAGVYELMDVEDRFDVLYEFGLQQGSSTGWPSLDTHYTVKTGQWTLVTGIPGHGKSSWLDALIVNLAQFQGWKFGMFSPENQPIERHYASLMEKVARAPFNEGSIPRLTVETKNSKKSWLNEHFKVILPDDEKGNWSVDGVLNLAKTLVYRFGIKGLVIDPWNELDHSRSNGLSETDHISASLTKIRRFAHENDVHIWVVAHPAKLNRGADGKYPVPTMYDISGCHSEDTEVLTSKGWIPHKEVNTEDLVACMDLDENVLIYDHPTQVLQFPWNSKKDGQMRHLQNEKLDALVTPNHRMVVKKANEASWYFIFADNVEGFLQFPVPSGLSSQNYLSHQYLQFCNTEIGRFPDTLWKQSRSVMQDVLNFFWAPTELHKDFPVMLGRDIERLAHYCQKEVISRPMGDRNVRLQFKVQSLNIDTSSDITLEDYQGIVYCLTVPTGAYVTRRNGKAGIYGNSAHWRNKADNGVTIYRNVGEEDDDICDIHIQKIRFKEIGRVGLVSLRCDRRCGIYHDDLDQVARARAINSAKIVPSSQIQVAPRGAPPPSSNSTSSEEDNDSFFDNLFGDKSNE